MTAAASVVQTCHAYAGGYLLAATVAVFVVAGIIAAMRVRKVGKR
jgi:hypothetical protein